MPPLRRCPDDDDAPVVRFDSLRLRELPANVRGRKRRQARLAGPADRRFFIAPSAHTVGPLVLNLLISTSSESSALDYALALVSGALLASEFSPLRTSGLRMGCARSAAGRVDRMDVAAKDGCRTAAAAGVPARADARASSISPGRSTGPGRSSGRSAESRLPVAALAGSACWRCIRASFRRSSRCCRAVCWSRARASPGCLLVAAAWVATEFFRGVVFGGFPVGAARRQPGHGAAGGAARQRARRLRRVGARGRRQRSDRLRDADDGPAARRCNRGRCGSLLAATGAWGTAAHRRRIADACGSADSRRAHPGATSRRKTSGSPARRAASSRPTSR